MKKLKLVQWAFRQGQKRMLRKAFSELRITFATFEEPIVIVVNHSNFYDSLVLFELEQRGFLPNNVVAMMSAEGLQKHSIFKGLGVIPVSNPMKLSEYKQTLHVMDEYSLLLFPQGKEEHQEKRPLSIEKGAATLLAKKQQHHILFVTLYYSFTKWKKGQIACRFHVVHSDNRPSSVESLHMFIEQTMTEQLNLLKEHAIEGQFNSYERICL